MKKDFFVIANNIRSLFNVGSVFRTADAFSVSKIFLTGYTPAPDNLKHKSKINKTALGAEDFVLWEKKKSAGLVIKHLKKQGIKIVALENNINSSLPPLFKRGGEMQILAKKSGIALLLGEEVKGINISLLKQCDYLLTIPMSGKKESLNVSVAFGIAAYEIKKHL